LCKTPFSQSVYLCNMSLHLNLLFVAKWPTVSCIFLLFLRFHAFVSLQEDLR
jgi:hypothetical protein